MPTKDRPGSKLIALGLAMAFGILMPNQLTNLLGKGHDAMTLPLAVFNDGLRTGFFFGLAGVVIGLLRNRESKKEEGPHA
jgi:hypothetical protein